MSFPRSSGILLHPTSLPGASASATWGLKPFSFWISWLAASRVVAGAPPRPTGYGDSPYQSFRLLPEIPCSSALTSWWNRACSISQT